MKREKVNISFQADKDLVEKARRILRERELSLAGFIRLKLKELINQEEGNGKQIH
jgi:hypothetical protein